MKKILPLQIYSKNLPFKENISALELNQATINHFYIPLSDHKIIKTSNLNKFKLIKIDDLPKINCMSIQMLKELYSTLRNEKLKLNESSSSYIFIGEDTNKYFCVGADLKYFYSLREELYKLNEYTNLCYYNIYAIGKCPTFSRSIFIWNGVTCGGGLALGIDAKYRIATESTSISMPESLFGYYSNCLFNNFIDKFLDEKEALHFSLFSHWYTGYEVYIKNFATHFILNKYLPALVEELGNVKEFEDSERVLNMYQERSIGEFKHVEKCREKLNTHKELVERIYDFEIDENNFLDFYENLKYNLKKLKLANLLDELDKRSILVLKANFEITLCAYRKSFDYEEKYNYDKIFVAGSLEKSNNMIEGIRANFIDKDKFPKWNAKF